MQLSMLVDLYLDQNVPKEMYLERKAHLNKRQSELDQEKADVLARLEISALSDKQVAEIEAFCSEVRQGLEYATFEDKQRYLELLDVHGTVVVENDERVVYISCRLGKQRLVLAATLPWTNDRKDNVITITARLVIPERETWQTSDKPMEDQVYSGLNDIY